MAPKRSRFFAAPPENDGGASVTTPPSSKSRPSKKRQASSSSPSSSSRTKLRQTVDTPTPEPDNALISKAAKIAEQLEATFPNPPIPLDHETPYQLLVAVVLSAQCTVSRYADDGIANLHGIMIVGM